ncbi:SGNH/GDSL hydrolase family protein [Leptospira langatensis]|uniref:SGNH/GDSL hydrolase family protein n=1 Tax=Leptospira langatensis TaxID=2484983 RepID=A0A5F1ZPK0_9LEPT|nr:SGNH/GDSL hydrolase family protein [Leptospira langatensis]TGL38788.1 SGNH/GDSL hydrolase family protein [Leptospira langatensis]
MIRFSSYSVLFFLFLEVLLRLLHFPSVEFRLEDKQLHCLSSTAYAPFSSKDPSRSFSLKYPLLRFLHRFSEEYIPWMRLCPNQDITLFHPEKNRTYRVRTNSFGERITAEDQDTAFSDLGLEKNRQALDILREEHTAASQSKEVAFSKVQAKETSAKKQIWILGDSVAMGYLVSDENSLPWLLQSSLREKGQNLLVRNLAVDAVGSLGIQERLKEVLKNSKPPKAAYWIYHISDFTDSFHEEILFKSRKKRILVQISYYLSRYSAVYNSLKVLYEKYKPESADNLVIPSSGSVLNKEHPHRLALISLFTFAKENDIPLVLVLLPEPRENYEPFVDSELVKEVRQIALDSNTKVLDLQTEIYDLWKKERKEVFLPLDGHPNEDLYRFISTQLAKDILNP